MGNSHTSSPAPLRLIKPPPPTNPLSPKNNVNYVSSIN